MRRAIIFRFFLAILIRTSKAQQGCVWSDFASVMQSDSLAQGIAAAPVLPPNSTCSGRFAWASCSSGCTTITCSGQYDGVNFHSYAGVCKATVDVSASQIQTILLSDGGSGTCSESAGVTPVSSPAAEPPLTSSTVYSSSLTGSVGGSVVGSVIVSFIGWLLSNYGDSIAKSILGTVWKDVKGWFKKHDKDESQDACLIISIKDGMPTVTGVEKGKLKVAGSLQASSDEVIQGKSTDVHVSVDCSTVLQDGASNDVPSSGGPLGNLSQNIA